MTAVLQELTWHLVEGPYPRECWWQWPPGMHCMSLDLEQLNDRIWGEGHWTQCSHCPHDSNDRPVFHHKDAHR